MSTSEDEYDGVQDEFMDLENGANGMHDDDESGFDEDVTNGANLDGSQTKLAQTKKKVARGVSGREFVTENEEKQSDDEEDFGDNQEAELFEQLSKERMTDTEFFSSLMVNEGNGKQSKDKKWPSDDTENNLSYIAPRKIEELEKLTDPQKIEIIRKESPELMSTLNEFKKCLKEVKNKFLPLLSYLRNKKFKISEGISYLDVKFELLLSYCMNLAFYILLKLNGKIIKDHPVLRRLIYIKSLLSKLKPLDKKLEYQINKLLKMATQQNLIGENYVKSMVSQDPLSLAPRPGKILKDLTTDGMVQERSSNKKGEDNTAIYRAPKLSAAIMETDKKEAKRLRLLEQQKRKLYRSEFVQGLENELNEEPEEIRMGNPMKEFDDDIDKEREQFEEENFTRLPTTKEDKRRLHEKKRKAENRVDDFEEFEKIRAVVRDTFNEEQEKRQVGQRKLKDSMSDYVNKRNYRTMREDDKPERDEDSKFRDLKKQKQSKSPNFRNRDGDEDNSGNRSKGSDIRGSKGKGKDKFNIFEKESKPSKATNGKKKKSF